MSVGSDILEFLRAPQRFAATVSRGQVELWQRGLAFVEQQSRPLGRELRPAQVHAWRGSADQRVSLILGPPGTGKTFLLAGMATGLLRACRESNRPCRILLTGFTRESIGNLFEDLVSMLAANFPEAKLVFFGSPPDQPLPAGVVNAPLRGKNQVAAARNIFAGELQVAGATAWSLYKLFEGGLGPHGDGPTARVFDLVMIDEASQMMVAQGLMCLSGLAADGRIVVAGDDRQLPPVRPTHDAAMPDGRLLGGSLYGFLKSGNAAEFRLEETFRLNEPLVAPVASQFYDGKYFSAEAVQNRRLRLVAGWETGLEAWQRKALDPELPLCILMHDGPPASSENAFERFALRLLVERLAERLPPGDDLWQRKLAVVTPHRAQNAALRQDLGEHPWSKEVVVETVDRIQGRERDVILAGYCVSDPEFALIEATFLFDARRLNVTVTRARSKLVLLVSRRLLQVVPEDEEVFDAAGQLREYIYDSPFVDRVEIPGPDGKAYSVEIRGRTFSQPAPPSDADQSAQEPSMATQNPPIDEGVLAELLAAVQAAANDNEYGSATRPQIKLKLRRMPSIAELRLLFERGLVTMQLRPSQYGKSFSVWAPRENPMTIYASDIETVRARLKEVVDGRRGQYPMALYRDVCDSFAWFDDDENDVFRPILNQLVDDGVCVVTPGKWSAIDRIRIVETQSMGTAPTIDATAIVPEPADPSGADFEVLNALENEEIRQINFGAYETSHSVSQVAKRMARPEAEVRQSLKRLLDHRYLLLVGDRMVRSRMSDLARMLRYVKQRFGAADAGNRPFLVRSIQMRVLDRRKPSRNQDLEPAIQRLKKQLLDVPQSGAILDELAAMLRDVWQVPAKTPVMLAGFQIRALEALTLAYLKRSDFDSHVITADTGSGKTEAAIFPLMVGALVDRLAGIRGVKAILVYPRIRLAYNQAQRLTGYFAAMAKRNPSMLLTIGVQSKDVPGFFPGNGGHFKLDSLRALWNWRDDVRAYDFPFFRCPACSKDLLLFPGDGETVSVGAKADRLSCPACKWTFRGWIGTKQAVAKSPPDFFLPVTESLHQWLHDPSNGHLFGDVPGSTPPRALLADEIHLYSHIHGIQVGYAFQRLLARAWVNARRVDPNARRPLAIGMSATLGEPAAVWGTLVGRIGDVERIAPDGSDELETDPRGREYFYFVQPEVESRGQRIAGESATIQALMCLAHGMRRRSGERGGYRGLVFFDSIDSLKRLLDDYRDAEQGKGLASLRTRRYPDDPLSKKPRNQCCGKPAECDLFKQGECWAYAAGIDPHQVAAHTDGVPVAYRPGQALRVMPQPVFSGNNERIERMIGQNDLVFTTSSLEVGFDDDEMILVYQHYAPMNLASFIQRKGRGGRGIEDRPVTGVTLSIYSPRDAWYFRHPDEMLRTDGFEIPLNVSNFFVRRGQAVAALLDGVAQACARAGRDLPDSNDTNLGAMRKFVETAKSDVDLLIRTAMGEGIYDELKVDGVLGLWDCVAAEVKGPADQRNWRQLLPWIPDLLFDAINLPLLAVEFPKGATTDVRNEDIALLFGQCAPGNATRRFGARDVHWLPPTTEAFAPMLRCADDYKSVTLEPLVTDEQRSRAGNRNDALDRVIRTKLPDEVNRRLPGVPILHELCRPSVLRLETLGVFDAHGHWMPHWFWDQSNRRLDPAKSRPSANHVAVSHKSSASLLSFPLLEASPGLGRKIAVPGLSRLAKDVVHFTGGVAGGSTGLAVARAFWGVDVHLRLDDRQSTEEVWTVVFSDPQREQPRLHGYTIETEGIQLPVDSAQLDEFLKRETSSLEADGARRRMLHGQHFRYLLTAWFSAAGLSSYVSGPLADLLIAASDDQALAKRLAVLRKRFDVTEFTRLLEDAHRERLQAHPLLSPKKFESVADEIKRKEFADVFQRAVDEAADSNKFRGYLRSLVLHGLALSLKELFVLHGRGDERQTLIHAELPIQFASRTNDTLSVFESGDHGDGTTRTFVKHAETAFASWRHGDLADCPFAAEDALLEMLFAAPASKLEKWRKLRPDDPATLPTIGKELTGTSEVEQAHLQVIGRVLFQSELVGSDRFHFFDLHREIRAVRARLEQRERPPSQPTRRPTTWELVSAVVASARNGSESPIHANLLAAYRKVITGLQGHAPSAEARLADQIYRLSASLCVDGCRACLHRSSTLMPDSQTASAVSRGLLQRYREFLLEPLTLSVDKTLPKPEMISTALKSHGGCRLLVIPAIYDHLAPELGKLGFASGTFDPLLKAVVCLYRR